MRLLVFRSIDIASDDDFKAIEPFRKVRASAQSGVDRKAREIRLDERTAWPIRGNDISRSIWLRLLTSMRPAMLPMALGRSRE
jgi:hypothetical protein